MKMKGSNNFLGGSGRNGQKEVISGVSDARFHVYISLKKTCITTGNKPNLVLIFEHVM